MSKFLLLDTFNFLHRAYHALPKTFRDENGEPTNAVYGVASMLITIFDSIRPDYVVAALDGKQPTFRSEEFTAYKAHRAEIDVDLVSQIPKVLEILDAFNLKKIVLEGYEADDIIGTCTKKFATSTVNVIIASNDRDLWQLINKNVSVMLPNTIGPSEWIGENEVVARLGVRADQIPDYKGLRGDVSDNIPGVYGIGEKTAQKLISEFGSIENIYTNLQKVSPDSLRQKLEESYETALLSKKLATIITDAPLSLFLDECKYTEFNKIAASETLKKYNFKSLIRRLGLNIDDGSTKKKEVSKDQVSLF